LSPAFSAADDKLEITPAVLSTSIHLSVQLGKLRLLEKRSDIARPYSCPYLRALVVISYPPLVRFFVDFLKTCKKFQYGQVDCLTQVDR
jgi:hypothetical protein